MDKITLEYPVTLADGRQITHITLRRGNVRDMKAAQRTSDNRSDQEIALIALLSEEKLTPEDIEELDMADYAVVQTTFQRLATPGAKPGSDKKTVGDAGPVVQDAAKRD